MATQRAYSFAIAARLERELENVHNNAPAVTDHSPSEYRAALSTTLKAARRYERIADYMRRRQIREGAESKRVLIGGNADRFRIVCDRFAALASSAIWRAHQNEQGGVLR